MAFLTIVTVAQDPRACAHVATYVSSVSAETKLGMLPVNWFSYSCSSESAVNKLMESGKLPFRALV